MATIPAFTTVRAGVDKLTASLWNGQIVAALQFLLGSGAGSKDYCTVRQTVSQSIPTGGSPLTAITFDTVDTDHAGGFNSLNPTRYTPQTAGNYRMSGSMSFASNVTGARQALARVTHADTTQTAYYAGSIAAPSGSESVIPIAVDFPTVVGDYVECMVCQLSGVALGTFLGNAIRPGPRVTFEWVSVA